MSYLWAHLDSNQGPTGYASHYSFRCPFRVCGLDYPFTPEGCLPSSLYTFLSVKHAEAWLGITISSDAGFPEFGRCRLKITLQAALGNRPY